MKLSLPPLQTDKIFVLTSTYLNPTLQNCLALKMQFGIRLQAEDMRQALSSSLPNPIKDWLIDLVCCYIRLICNHQAAALRQLLLTQRQRAEYIALLIELDKIKSHQKTKLLFADINAQVIERFNEQVAMQDLSLYQTHQLAKVNELLFWASIVTDEKQFAKILLAVDARYYWLAKGEKRMEVIEEQLLRNEIPEWERQTKEELVQAYKDHIRLTSTATIQKIVPEIVNDPEKAVIFAQTSAVNEELLVNYFEQVPNKVESKNQITNSPTKNKFTFFNNPSLNKYNELFFNLDILYNDALHQHFNISEHEMFNLEELLTSLKELSQLRTNQEMEKIILLNIQNSIDTLSLNPDLHEIVKCLERWQVTNNHREGHESNYDLFNRIPGDIYHQNELAFNERLEHGMQASEESRNYRALISFIEREYINYEQEEQGKHLKKIIFLTEHAQKAPSEQVADYNEQIIDELGHLINNYPSLPIIKELCDLITKLPQIESGEILFLKF